MATSRRQRLSQLWQFPLLVVSLGFFAVAGYLFINPQPKATIQDKINVARNYLKQDRPEAAIEQLNKILDSENPQPQVEGVIHIMLGEALEAGQIRLKLNIPQNYARIIEQTQLGLSMGMTADAAIHRRLGDSYSHLGNVELAESHYHQAIALDPDHGLDLRRKVIDLQLANDQADAAELSIDEYLKQAGLAAAEKSWAMGQKAQMLIDRRKYDDARALLAGAIKLTTDTAQQGEYNYRLGYCTWKEGDDKEAERLLRLARDELKPSHPLDGDAAYVLGRIFQDRGDPKSANSFYQITLLSHPESPFAPLALQGRGMCRLMLKDFEAGLEDLRDVAMQMSQRQARSSLKAEAVLAMVKASAVLSGAENYEGALEVMGYEQQLDPKPPASFFARLGNLYEKRATQLERSIADATAAEQVRRAQEVRELRAKAGDAFVANSRAQTMSDDQGYGDALWHGIDLYDQSGDLQRTISALNLFVLERPEDRLSPDALLRLGRAYQAAGNFDKAIDAYQRNQIRYPNSIAASKSAVPLAQAYISRGPKDYGNAEKVLLGVVENNALIDPSAEEFHQALFELAQLLYLTHRYEPAIARLEEIMHRYPGDAQLPQLTFLMADSYRKSATLLQSRLASASNAPGDIAEAVSAQHDRWTKARQLFDQVLDLYSNSPPNSETDKLYQKLSCFYRADCMYDLGKYEEAIKLYDQAAFRYQDDPSALAAYVQIVNSYRALGKLDDARTANERAKWILRRMPAEAFKDGTFSMPKEYWDDWLKWTSESGVF